MYCLRLPSLIGIVYLFIAESIVLSPHSMIFLTQIFSVFLKSIVRRTHLTLALSAGVIHRIIVRLVLLLFADEIAKSFRFRLRLLYVYV